MFMPKLINILLGDTLFIWYLWKLHSEIYNLGVDTIFKYHWKSEIQLSFIWIINTVFILGRHKYWTCWISQENYFILPLFTPKDLPKFHSVNNLWTIFYLPIRLYCHTFFSNGNCSTGRISHSNIVLININSPPKSSTLFD